MGKIVRIILSTVEQPVPSRDTALKVCFNLGIKVIRFTEQRNNFVAHCVDDNDAATSLMIYKLKPYLVLDLNRNYHGLSIIRKLDEDILNSSYGEIANELREHNPWMQLYELWKSFNMLKPTLRTINMAQRSIDGGFYWFYLHIPKFNIERDFQINVNICDYCFAYEHHRSANCPKRAENPQFQTCSVCAAIGHHFSRCSAPRSSHKCINCNGNHHAKSFSCPVRKKIVAEKRKNGDTVKSFADLLRPSSSIYNNNDVSGDKKNGAKVLWCTSRLYNRAFVIYYLH